MIPSTVKKFLLNKKEAQGYFCVAINKQLNIIQYYGQAKLFGLQPPKYYLSIAKFLPEIATETFDADFEIPFCNISEKHVCNVYFLKSKNTSFLVLIDKSEIFQATKKHQQFAQEENTPNNEFKKLVQELKQAQDKLKKSNQEKAKIIALLTHQLGTPLTSIVGYSELLTSKLVNSQKGLEIINRNANYLKHIIENTLMFGQPEAGGIELKIEPISLQNLFNTLKATLLPAAINKNISLQMFYKDTEKINIDISRTKQILLNVLNNAIKHTDTGSVELKFSQINGSYLFSIIDTGLGVPKHLQKNIFNPWDRIKENRDKGTNIGLFISQRLAQDIGGELKLKYSKSGFGSIFQLVLPVQEIPKQNNGQVSDIDKNLKEKSLLIIDYNYDLVELIKVMLSTTDLKIHTAISIEQAKKMLSTKEINMVLTDVNLGSIKASSFVQKIKVNHPNMPVILMSAMPSKSLNNKYKSQGFNAIISKPLDKKALLSAIIENF